MSSTSQQSGRTQARGSQSRMTVRLGELAQQERDSVFYAPRGADWLWLGLFAAVMLGSGFYLWQELGFDSVLGRAAFFAAVLLSILWAALIYTLKLSAGVTVGRQGIGVTRGPWRSELIWSEVERLQERREAMGHSRLRWLVVRAYDGRELRVREDMVTDFTRLSAEVYERRRLWEEHGGAWGASGGGPFSAEEQVAGLVTWWLVAAGALLLPGLYFAVLLPDTFLLGVALVALALVASLRAVQISLGRTTYVVDQRSVVARRKLSRRALSWGKIIKVQRVRSRVRVLARVGIVMGRLLLAIVARADSRLASFPWSPRVPEYLVLRAEGGRRIRVRLHRLPSPDELLAWIEFYDRVARHSNEAARLTPTTPANPASHPQADSAAAAAGQPVPSLPATSSEARNGAPPAPSGTTGASGASGPKATKPVLGGSGGHAGEIDPRILAMMREVGDAPTSGPGGTASDTATNGATPARRAPDSDWLNESADESFLRFRRAPSDRTTSSDDTPPSSSAQSSSAGQNKDADRGGGERGQ